MDNHPIRVDGEAAASRLDLAVDNISIPPEVLAVLETTRGKAHALAVLSKELGDDACRYIDAYFATEEGKARAAANSKKAVIAHNHGQKRFEKPLGFPSAPAKEEAKPARGWLSRLFGGSSN